MSAAKKNAGKPRYNTSQLLHESIYPAIDAVASGLLDSLNPNTHRSHEHAAYRLCCPVCQKKEAYYYAGSSMVICGREKNCGAKTTLFDIVKDQGSLSNFETLKQLADVAGVALDNDSGHSELSASLSLIKHFKACASGFLKDSPNALAYLRDARGYSEADIKQLPLGFYPDERTMRQALEQDGVDLKLAESWGLLNPRSERKPHMCTGRVIGYWEQPDGSIRIWGRDITDNPKTKKYFFCPGQDGMAKTIPYRFRSSGKGVLLCVEGMLDAETLQLLGLPGCAIGGAQVIQAQARYFVSKHIPQILHIIDGDEAGRKGAIKTIRNCERLGIQTLIGITPEGWDDVDALRRQGKPDRILAIIEHAVTGGEFLARQLLQSLDLNGSMQHGLFREFEDLRRTLTPSSAASFDSTLLRYGIELGCPERQALQLADELLASGMQWPEINELLNRRYALTISIQSSQENS